MKEIFENKKKFYLFAILLFTLLLLLFRLFYININNYFSFAIFPTCFFFLSILFCKSNKFDWNIPIVLSLIYFILGYLILQDAMVLSNVLFSFFVSFLTLSIIYLYCKNKKISLKIDNEKELQHDKKIIISHIMPFLILLCLETYYLVATFGVLRITFNFVPSLIAVLIMYSLYFILLNIVRNTSVANKSLAIIFLIVFIINEGRIYYTSDTLLLTDVLFLQNAGEVGAFAGVSLLNCIYSILVPTLLLIIVFAYLFKISKKANVKVRYTRGVIAKGIVSLLILLVLFLPNETFNNYLINNSYNIYKSGDYAITASNTRYFYKYGVLSGMYGKFIEARRFKPSGYNEKELKNILDNSTSHEGTWNKPNIIVVFSESFWDVSKLEKIKFDKDVTPNFHKLSNVGKSIEMISPSYGGMSSNVEFEILTGGSLDYFSKGYTPYMQLFTKGLSEKNPSIIKELKNNGYKTKILNSSSANMFNCDSIYDFYGVDERNHLYDEIDLGGEYVTDSYLTDQVIDYFNNKDSEESIFYFVITMGGHMPYYEERYQNYDVNIIESPYTSDVNEVIHSYAEGIYLADKELGRLYDYINTIDEETIIVFFGDHLPHLVTPNGKDALFTTNYLSSNYDLESVYKQYNTTALILSNYEIDYDETNYLSPDLLLTYILNNMDIELSSYYKWLYNYKDILPSSNYVVAQDNTGKIYYTLNLKDEMKKAYELRRKIQYMLFK